MSATPSESRSLLIDCSSGFRPACDTFLEIWRPIFRRIASRIARQFVALQETDDVTQEICLKIISAKQKLAAAAPDAPVSFQAYVSVVAANTARDWFRRSGRRESITFPDSGFWELVPGRSHGIERDLLIQQIENSLSCSDRDRTIFRLYYRQGYSAREIALIPALGLSIKGVETILHRLNGQIREKLSASNRGEGKVPAGAS